MAYFEELQIPEELIKILEKQSITKPTPVQKLIIPKLLNKENIVFRSDTGTGKTLAYLLPAFLHCDTSKQTSDPQILIIAPTNELASQIKNEAEFIAKHSTKNIKTTLLIGSVSFKRQFELLKNKPLIIVGTPARILELARLKKLKLHVLSMLILDEADRMLSPEMRNFIRDILHLIAFETQLVASSATITTQDLTLLENFLHFKTNKKQENKTKVKKIEYIKLPTEKILHDHIEHWAIWSEQRKKINTLRKFIHAEKPKKALIFTSRTGQVNNICSQLQYRGLNAASLHAKLDKKERKAAIDAFRTGKISILITSDLAARGLDIQNISHVIQFDVNENEDFFIHRAGRTARAGKKGINVIFGDAKEMHALSRIEKKLGIIVHPKELYMGKVQKPHMENTEKPESKD